MDGGDTRLAPMFFETGIGAAGHRQGCEPQPGEFHQQMIVFIQHLT
jgi:hypothetical protein